MSDKNEAVTTGAVPTVVAQIPAVKVEGGSSTGVRKDVAAQIGDLLRRYPTMRLKNVIPIPISKIGGVDYEYLVVLTDGER